MVTTSGSGQVASIAVRAVTAGVLITMFVAGGRIPNLTLAAAVVIGALAFERRHVLTLKNFFLAYALVVFGVGAAVLNLAPESVFADLVWYLVAFLVGYVLGSIRTSDGPDAQERPTRPPDTVGVNRRELRPGAVEAALVGLIALNLAFLVAQFFRYGIVGYYRGEALLEQFLSYGQASPGGGAEQIVRFLLRFGALGLIVLYVQACFETPARIRYRYPVALLVLLPILALRRYDAVVGAITVLAIYGCERRVNPRRPEERGDKAATRPRTGAGLTRAVALGGAVASAVLAALAIGLLRQGFTVETTGSAAADTGSLPILTSELTPVQAYGDIRANIGVLGHPHGRTIVLPLVLKMVPRAWYPDKPLNSGAYYMTTLRPAEFAAGFAVPPTFFGDAYLNFGFGGALAACLLLGIAAARLDRAYKGPIPARVPLFLLIWANFFSIMRDPLSESLAGVLLTLAVWGVAGHLLRAKAVTPPATPAVRAPPRLLPARVRARSDAERLQ